MKIGYLRVSTEDQDTARQEDGLSAICDELHVERLSATAHRRPVFERVLTELGEGDALVVWDLDRAFRSTIDMLSCLEELRARGVRFQIVTLSIDTATESGQLVATMMAAVAQFERQLISRRTKEGMAARRKRGAHIGRPHAVSPEQLSKAREEIIACRETVSSMARLFGVDRRTLGRALKRDAMR